MDFPPIASLLLLSSTSLACSTRAVDLDASPSMLVATSNEPGVVGVVHERVRKLAVDDQRLYWMGTLPVDGHSNAWFLHSCEKRNCAATLVTYDAQPYDANNGFTVVGDQIYWAYLGNAQARVSSCAVSGCVGALRQLVTDFYYSRAPLFDGSDLYFITPAAGVSIFRQPGQPGAQRRLVVSDPRTPASRQLAIHEAHAYWLTQNELRDETSLLRARKDGASSVVETIANDVKYSDNHEFGTATDATSVYWTDNLLAGSIQRCPLTGCTGPSEVVLAALFTPQALLIDGSELYYVHETKPYEYAVSSCTLPTCVPSSPLFEHLNGPDMAALDDEYLYVATTEQDIGPDSSERVTARIRRLPKPNRRSP